MTYAVSSGTLNSTIPYKLQRHHQDSIACDTFRQLWATWAKCRNGRVKLKTARSCLASPGYCLDPENYRILSGAVSNNSDRSTICIRDHGLGGNFKCDIGRALHGQGNFQLSSCQPIFSCTGQLSPLSVSRSACKAPVKSSPPTNPTFYRLDALPVAQPKVLKHWRDTAIWQLARENG